MAERWVIWIVGSNNYVETDDNSEVALSALETALQTVDETNWLKCEILGTDARRKAAKSPEPRNGGIVVNTKGQYKIYEIAFFPFFFPDAEDKVDQVLNEFNFRYTYICMDGEDQAANTKYSGKRLHAEGKCLAVALVSPQEDWVHEEGSCDLAIEARKRKPEPQL